MRLLRYVWAGPWTLIAAALAPVVALSGGRVAIQDGILELAGGILPAILRRLPPGRVAAITVGHAVLALDGVTLNQTRAHERVHVAQFERWGLFFPLVYGLASWAAWRRGQHYYLDNRFEREARQGDSAGRR